MILLAPGWDAGSEVQVEAVLNRRHLQSLLQLAVRADQWSPFYTEGTLEGSAAPAWLGLAATNRMRMLQSRTGPRSAGLHDNALWDFWPWEAAANHLNQHGEGWEALPPQHALKAEEGSPLPCVGHAALEGKR